MSERGFTHLDDFSTSSGVTEWDRVTEEDIEVAMEVWDSVVGQEKEFGVFKGTGAQQREHQESHQPVHTMQTISKSNTNKSLGWMFEPLELGAQ